MVLFCPKLGGDNEVHNFPKGMSLKMNVIVRLEGKLAYCDVTPTYVCYNAM